MNIQNVHTYMYSSGVPLTELRRQTTRSAMMDVLQNTAKLTGAVSTLMETTDSYSKLSKGGKVQGTE